MAEQRAGAVAGRAMFTLIGAAGLVIGAFLPWVRASTGTAWPCRPSSGAPS